MKQSRTDAAHRRWLPKRAPRTAAGAATSPQLVRFLLRPSSYPVRPRRVVEVQTHASRVFVAGAFVYKVRKPVNFGFLDYSTLAKRLHFAQREIVLNRRFSSGVYLGVTPIFIREGRYTFVPSGQPVEYAVRMRLLARPYFLDELLRHGRVQPRHIDRIVRRLAGFYQQQRTRPEVARWGHISRLRISTDENFRQTRVCVGSLLSPEAYAALRLFTNGFYRQQARLLHRRVRTGRILDCHGDLHCEHVHLHGRRLTIYDCIEFNDRLRYLDVASDVAFLSMDLDAKGHPELGRRLERRMARALGDDDFSALMPFYRCYRAMVRAKVESLRGREGGRDASAAAARARRYFELALGYAACGTGPMVLAVMGSIGCGKSTLARALSQALGWPLLTSDVVRKGIVGLPLHRRTPTRLRPEVYSTALTRRTYLLLRREAAARILRQASCIVDATFSQAQERDRLRTAIEAAGGTVLFLELRAPLAQVRHRLRRRTAGDISDAREEDLPMAMARYESPTELDEELLLRVWSQPTAAKTLALVLKRLVTHHLKRQGAGHDS